MQNWDCAHEFPEDLENEQIQIKIPKITFCCNSAMFNSLSWTDYFLLINHNTNCKSYWKYPGVTEKTAEKDHIQKESGVMTQGRWWK